MLIVRHLILGSKAGLKNGADLKHSSEAISTKETHVTAYPFHTLP